MNILNSFFSYGRKAPHSPAFVYPGGQLTRAETADTVNRIAGQLHTRGITTGHTVGISQEFSPIMQCILILAVWHRSATSCLLSEPQITRPTTPTDLLITPTHYTNTPDTAQLLLDQHGMRTLANTPPLTQTQPYKSLDDTCHLIFSSGTTGTPKAIPITLRQLSDRLRGATTNWLNVTPFLAILGINSISGFLTFAHAMRTGHPCYLAGTAHENCDMIHRHAIRGITASPAQLTSLATALSARPQAAASLTQVISAGSTLPNHLRDHLTELTTANICNLYGSSEIGGVALGTPSDSKTGLAGRLLPQAEIRIVDEHNRVLGDGQVGIVQVRRAAQFTGYHHNPDATAAAFSDGWFLPGDLGHINAGELFLTGRNTEVFNVGGVKLVASTLEHTLLTLPGIEDVAVTTTENELGVPQLTALYVGAAEFTSKPALRRLGELCGETTPRSMHRVPTIPRNLNGKIDRAEVSKLAIAADHG